MVQYIEPGPITRFLTAAVVLPSDVYSNFTVHVSNDEYSLHVTFPCPIQFYILSSYTESGLRKFAQNQSKRTIQKQLNLKTF